MTKNLSENEALLSVLVADSDSDGRRKTQAMLAEAGIGSDGAGSAAEAMDMVRLRHARRQDYDLILVDQALTEQEDGNLAREIRDLIGENASVILITFGDGDGDKDAKKSLTTAEILREYRRARRIREAGNDGPDTSNVEGKRILVAEDMTVSAEIVKQMLAMNFLSVDHAEDGQKAVDLFQKSPAGYYDAILMDISMPVMDGFDATKAIRALPRPDAKIIPIIALTSNRQDVDVQLSLAAGMDAHLEKPVDPEQLYRTLVEFIGKR